MKKSEQLLTNKKCKDAHDDLNNCIVWFGSTKLGQLRNCKAEVYKTDGYTYLKSYNTIVACIGDNDNRCYDFLRMVYEYTSTSAQHINKFYHDYGAEYVLTYRPI